jgi:3'-phosphoadenosine 5'-phosphosulfate sulfotransferase (PAPS reductase)/FAD synthetase
MTNSYQIESPALISFSGGRTSGYMLKQILDANAGRLPPGIVACFANTGKEMPETLDFVQDCSRRWDVAIVWLEYSPDGEKQRKFRVVNHQTASRQGEPYEALLRERKYLPNPVTRFCTTQLLCGHSAYVAASHYLRQI